MAIREETVFRPGEIVPGSDFRVIRPLGEGGMGAVYEVEDISVGRRFVLKTIHMALLDRKDLLGRFQREARILAQLNHPNIVEVITFKWTTDARRRCYYVMEKLNGRNLRHILRDRGALGLDRSYGIGIDLFDAIDHAHDHRVIHRDIKPENIFIHKNREGQWVAKLLDFGVMKLVEGDAQTSGRFLGTVRYAAPEQLEGWGVDKKSDLYAGGLVLFDMIAGRGPFDEILGDAVIEAHLHKVPPRLSELSVEPVPRRLDDLVASLLAKDLQDRPKNALEVASILRELKQELLGETHAHSAASQATTPDMVQPSHIPSAVPSTPSLAPLREATAKEATNEKGRPRASAASGERAPSAYAASATLAGLGYSNPRETRPDAGPTTSLVAAHMIPSAPRIQDALTGSLPPDAYLEMRTDPIRADEVFLAPQRSVLRTGETSRPPGDAERQKSDERDGLGGDPDAAVAPDARDHSSYGASARSVRRVPATPRRAWLQRMSGPIAMVAAGCATVAGYAVVRATIAHFHAASAPRLAPTPLLPASAPTTTTRAGGGLVGSAARVPPARLPPIDAVAVAPVALATQVAAARDAGAAARVPAVAAAPVAPVTKPAAPASLTVAPAARQALPPLAAEDARPRHDATKPTRPRADF